MLYAPEYIQSYIRPMPLTSIVSKQYIILLFISITIILQPGNSLCGTTHLDAATGRSKRYQHLSETGTIMAACRHNILFKALNMYRGEMYAYSICLQLQLRQQDVICKYRPYLERCAVQNASDASLQCILKQKPFLSVMHAYSHSWFCQVLCSF